jgi:hypothetical protein
MTVVVDPDVLVGQLVRGMSDADYHADPIPGGSLSQSGAKLLLPPSCPAIFDWQRKHGRPPKAAFDLGHAAHNQVLGTGPEIVTVAADDWRTKSAQTQRAEAYDRGAVPILTAEAEQVRAMATALREHPIAGKLFDPDRGEAEVSAFWRDDETGVTRRARFDFLPHTVPGRRLVIPDYKTAASANPEKWVKRAADFGYHMQDVWYCDAARALRLADDVAFVFIVQETTAPYLVSVIQLDVTARAIGALLNRRALNVYAECTASGVWPGYTDGIALASLPAYVERQYETDLYS